MRKFIALALLFVVTAPALAWNDKGHMVVARLAWRQLSEKQRGQVVAILKLHPHYEEFLAANKPEGFSEDEWVFMRATTWADWVRSHHAEDYNKGPWHYVNYPFVPPGSKVDPAKHQPPAGQENVVNSLTICMEKIKTGTDVEKAVFMTWLFHLVGDIHQPLHCVAMFSEKYPDGDQGGNLVAISLKSGPVKLHSFWDGLLGRGLTPGDIGKDVEEIEAVLKDKNKTITAELEAHQTFESWALEGAELAKKYVYLGGELKLGRSAGRNTEGEAAPEAPAEYAPAAGKLARVQVGKAGTRLVQQLKKLFP